MCVMVQHVLSSPVVSPKVYVVVLNYNGWKDTLECLESLMRLTYTNYQIVIVDNFSSDDSLEHLRNWAKGKSAIILPEENTLKRLSYPPTTKPLPFIQYTQEEAEKGGNAPDDDLLILIQTRANLGFAGGNNVALRYVLAKKDADYVWLLNNDTVVESDSLSHLVQSYLDNKHRQVGIMGSKVRYYHKPSLIQCIAGAYYNKWLGYSSQIGNQAVDKGQFDDDVVQPDLIIGACMLVSTSFLDAVGLLNEEYFLYFEEQDWAERANRNGFKIWYTTRSVVYHKEGSTIGASQWQGKSRFSDFYFARSKLLFTERYFGPLIRFTVKVSFIPTILNRIKRRQFDRIPMLLSVMFNPHKSETDG